MRIGIGCIGVMHVICRYQFNSCLFAHPKKLRIDRFLFRDSVILKFQKKVSFPKNSFVAFRSTHCFFIHTAYQIFLYFSCQTRGQGNNAFVVRFQNFQIHTRFVIKSFCKSLRYNLHQIAVTRVILC